MKKCTYCFSLGGLNEGYFEYEGNWIKCDHCKGSAICKRVKCDECLGAFEEAKP